MSSLRFTLALALFLGSGGIGFPQTPEDDGSPLPKVILRIPTGDPVYSLSFVRDEQTLVSIGHDGANGKVSIWNVATGKERLRLDKTSSKGAPRGFHRFAIAPDAKTLVTHDMANMTMRFWDVATSKERGQLTKGFGFPDFSFSPNSTSLAALNREGMALVDVATAKQLFQVDTDSFQRVVFSPDGRQLATVGIAGEIREGTRKDTSICLWNIETKQQLWRQEVVKDHFRTVAISPDGQTVVAGGLRSIYAWDVTGRLLRKIASEHESSSLVFMPCGSGVVSAGHFSDTVCCWELMSGQLRWRLSQPNKQLPEYEARIFSAALSPSGRIMATGDNNRTIVIWDLLGHMPRVSLDQKNFEKLWSDLAEKDAPRAYRAICILAAHADSSLPLFVKHLQPRTRISGPSLSSLIADLDDDNFEKRERASSELLKHGTRAEIAARRALAKPEGLSAETRGRLMVILKRFEDRVFSPEQLRFARSVEVLERLGTPEGRRFLKELAQGDPDAWETQEADLALKRFARLAGTR